MQICILPALLDYVYIHLACQRIGQLYGGLSEHDTSCVETG